MRYVFPDWVFHPTPKTTEDTMPNRARPQLRSFPPSQRWMTGLAVFLCSLCPCPSTHAQDADPSAQSHVDDPILEVLTDRRSLVEGSDQRMEVTLRLKHCPA